MKYLAIVFCLVLAGCGSLSHAKRHKKSDETGVVAAIQKVLLARANIRAVISHPPRTMEELNDIANMNPNAMLFLAQDFAQRLGTISLDGCPRDFKDVFLDYVAAWTERAAASPNVPILVQPGKPPSGTAQNKYAERTESAWNAVKAICTKYGVTAE